MSNIRPRCTLSEGTDVFQEREVVMSRKLWIALAIAVGVLAFGATTAVAHRTSFNSEIALDDIDTPGDDIVVEGRVRSPNDRCKPNRLVTLFAGENSGTPDNPRDDELTFVGADRTGPRGFFRIVGEFPAGTDYFVLHVTRKNIGQGDHRHICRADTDIVPD